MKARLNLGSFCKGKKKMAVTVKEYLTYLRQKDYPYFLSKEDMDKLENVERIFGDLETEETILEICLSKKETGCDYSIRVDVDSPYVKEYWYELDSEACSKEDIPACYFIDASKVIPGEDNGVFYDTVLVKLIGEKRLTKLRKQLELCVAKLEGKSNKLFQLGTMTGRQELDRIRLFTDDLTREDFVNYLKELDWEGDLEALDTFLEQWESYSDGRKFILDFDILEDGISEKIGICFGTVSKKLQVIDEFLTKLQDKGLCLEEKKEDVLRFVQAFPSHTPFIQNDISHFKIPFQNDMPLMAKAYLRQGSVCVYNEFSAYDTPVLMNLELTTRCPLRCPQCYCDLTKGKDLELETALYWLNEAAKNHVRTVNLSGGETMLYPHLSQLIFDGVSGIFISLNGSTEEINAHSRDGYSLAIRALEILNEIGYEKTCINWVMHSNNADDFPNMIRLAETYHVAEIAVMVFSGQEKKVSAVEDNCKVDSVTNFDIEQEIQWCKRFKTEKTPVLPVINKVDVLTEAEQTIFEDKIRKELKLEPVFVSALEKKGIDDLKEAIVRLIPEEFGEQTITGDLVSEDDVVLLVMPQDIQAP